MNIASIIVFCLLCAPFLTVVNIYNLFANKKFIPTVIDSLIFSLGPVCTLLLYGFLNPLNFQEALHLSGAEFPFHEPVTNHPTILLLASIGFAGYVLLRIKRISLPPLVIALCMSAMYIGIILSTLWIVQLSSNFLNDTFSIIYLTLFPLNFIISTLILIRRIVKEVGETENQIHKNKLINWCSKILGISNTYPVIAFLLMWPLFGITVIILALFGQQPDAVIKAFTDTSDWFLSQKTSPPNVIVEDDYLCTVAAGGHPRVVRPQRMGMRLGRPIIVNRQLCVANAFEELIQMKTPRFHKLLRFVYDRCGYPIAKRIKTRFAADIAYFVMKPIEWFLLMILYFVEVKPENRIAKQYLTKIDIQ